MTFIDFRCRPPTAPFIDIQDNDAFKGLIESNGLPSMEARDPEAWLERLVEAGLTHGVVQGRDIETTFGYRVPNDHIADIVHARPDVLVGYAGIDPNKQDAVDELDRCVGDYGFRGISLDPYMHRLAIDDPRYRPLFERCVDLQIAVCVTGGPGVLVPGTVLEHASPLAVDRVMRDFPDLTLVMSHGGYPWVFEMIAVAWRWKGVFVDVSTYETLPGMQHIIDAADGVLRNKLLFASAEPFIDAVQAVELYQGFGLSEEALGSVMVENAQGVFGRTGAFA